jgi:hypothetical protein
MDILPPGLPPAGIAPLVREFANLFVCGPQLGDSFLTNLLERPISSRTAELEGYREATLEAFDWPVLVPADGDRVAGRLVRDLEAEDFFRLDAYQGLTEGLYRRVAVTVTVAGTPESAYVYLPTKKALRQQRR